MDTNILFSSRILNIRIKKKNAQVCPDRVELQPTFHYREILLQKLIGIGGFGKVYRSIRQADGSVIAVKFLKKRFWKNQIAKAQFLKETSIATILSHPNMVRYHGWGSTSQGAVFIVMDWVDGPNAKVWFQTERRPLADILCCASAVADALCAAHDAGLIHGDINPGNVLQSHNGTFLLTDFGFASSIREISTQRLGGTPGFLAPEQVSELFGPIGVHTDVYGLGTLIYWLLTEQAPATGHDLPEILANILSSKPPQDVLTLGSVPKVSW